MKRVNRRNNKDKSLLAEAYANIYREQGPSVNMGGGLEIGDEERKTSRGKKEVLDIEEAHDDEISGQRWSEEGDQFEPGAEDVAGYIQIDLYTGSVQTIRPEEVGPAVEGLDKVGPDTGDSDWNVWKGEEYMIAAIPK